MKICEKSSIGKEFALIKEGSRGHPIAHRMQNAKYGVEIRNPRSGLFLNPRTLEWCGGIYLRLSVMRYALCVFKLNVDFFRRNE